MKILIIEDDEKLRNELSCFLSNSGYNIEILENFNNTVDSIINSDCNLVLLDVNIPNLNGEMVCKEVRKTSSVPIIIVTSRNSELDELLSINYGADDFITKPYNTQILLARIERLINRSSNNELNIKYKDLLLDVSKYSISNNNINIDLSKNEFKILYYLVKNNNKIISRDELINYLWNSDEYIDDNTLTVNVNRLRNKLNELGYKDIIKTKRGEGYILI
jgi:DNA-binding response OmpR family regulator